MRRYAAHASRTRAAAVNGEADAAIDAEMEAMLPGTRWSLGRRQA